MKSLHLPYDYAVEQNTAQQDPHTVIWAHRLGYAGLIPFIASLLVIVFADTLASIWALQAMVAYGAVILTFVGALHWSTALLTHTDSPALLVISVLPSLVAWLALLMPSYAGMPLMILAYVAVYAFDRVEWQQLAWFVRLRSPLTLVAISCLTLGWLWSIW